MSKRLTDTAKWKNPWFRKLPNKYKLLFLYLLDECDNAGVMHLDWDGINFFLSERYSPEEFSIYLGDKVVFVADDKIVIKNFVNHQHNDNHPMMRKHVDKLLKSHRLLERAERGDFN